MLPKLRIKIIFALVRKELGYYFNNPFGYIAAFVFGIFANFMFVKDLFLIADGSMRQFFDILIWLMLIFVPIVGMRLFSEEKRIKTLELLMSLPVTIEEVVASKFISLMIFCFCAVSLTFIIPISLVLISTPHIPTIIVNYLGLLMYVGMVSSVVLFFSSKSSSQIVTLVFSIVTSFFLLVIGSDFFGSLLPIQIKNILIYFSPLNYLDIFFKGIIDLRSVAFFVVEVVIFLSLCVVSVRKNRL